MDPGNVCSSISLSLFDTSIVVLVAVDCIFDITRWGNARLSQVEGLKELRLDALQEQRREKVKIRREEGGR